MADVPFQSATVLAAALRDKTIGCRELLELYLGRVERFNPEAQRHHRHGSRRRIAGARTRPMRRWRAARSAGPLHGVPMTIKESYDVAGMPTTWGVPDLKENFPKRNALAVDRLLASGVVLFGKTNVPLLLADWQSFNAIYGTTNNPWDVTRVPGGSSWRLGGGASAAGLTGIEAGSDDIGASIRNPGA